MKILIAEDEENIRELYKISFDDKNYKVILTDNGVDCLDEYFKQVNLGKNSNDDEEKGNLNPPFDAVILDYRMPKKDGMEVAREILAAMPRQRIVFVSAYALQTLEESVKELNQVVELIQKPVEMDTIINILEDAEIWMALQKFNLHVKDLRKMNLSHLDLVDLYSRLKKIQKNIGI